MPKVSVIIPVYNVEKYLRECLDSVINQTLKDIEIICINDGSTDGSLNILREYEQKDSRIVVLDKNNEGVGISRNKGIDIANGEFVCFMDPDDLYPTDDILEVLYNKAVENNVKICGGEFSEFVNGTNDYTQKYSGSFSGYLFDKDGMVNYKDYQFDYGHTRFIYNKKFLEENNIFYPDYKRYEDPVFFVRAMYNAVRFYAVDKITYAYRIQHKLYSWSYETTRDLLKGIVDVLEFAKTNNLDGLSSITCNRLCNEYYIKIQNFIVDDNKILFEKCLNIVPQLNQIIFKQKVKCFIQKILSIKNEYKNNIKTKVITILGIRITLRVREDEQYK